MITTQTTIDKINNFDYYYEMSDDSRKYSQGARAEKEIHVALDAMTNEELIEVRDGLTKDMDLVNRYFNQFATIEEPTPEPSKLSKVMTTAWTYFRGGLYESFSLALRAAWAFFKLSKTLRRGIAYFTYKKADGSLRNAIGTLHGHNFDYQHKTSKRATKAGQVKYWDVVARAWRSFRIERLVSIQ